MAFCVCVVIAVPQILVQKARASFWKSSLVAVSAQGTQCRIGRKWCCWGCVRGRGSARKGPLGFGYTWVLWEENRVCKRLICEYGGRNMNLRVHLIIWSCNTPSQAEQTSSCCWGELLSVLETPCFHRSHFHCGSCLSSHLCYANSSRDPWHTWLEGAFWCVQLCQLLPQPELQVLHARLGLLLTEYVKV